MSVVGVIYGGGQIPSANYLTGEVIKRLLIAEHSVFAIKKSFMGLADDTCYEQIDFKKARKISKIPGTYLGMCRNVDPSTDMWFSKIIENLIKFEITTLVVLGGDGSSRGCFDFLKRCQKEKYQIKVIFIPCTIDGMNGTFTFGALDAIYETAHHIEMAAVNAWATFDYGKISSRISIVEVQGRNRNDIAVGALKKIITAGKIANYKLNEIEIIFLASGYTWSAERWLMHWTKTKRPVLIIVSEGAKPIEQWWNLFEGSVGEKLEKFINTSGVVKSNLEKVGYLSQTNCAHKERALIKKVVSSLDFCKIEETEESFAVFFDQEGECYFDELGKIVKLNPNSSEPVKLDEVTEKLLKPYMNF